MIAAAVLALALVQGQAAAAPAPQDTFPHALHERLFTSCSSCHAGIVSGDTATASPTPDTCAQCHDGQSERRVTWTPRPPRPTNLKFDHRTHFDHEPLTDDDRPDCRACHATSPSGPFMEVGAAGPESCLACHTGPTHLAASNTCSECHRPLPAATRLAAATIAAFPKPATHDSNYVFAHANDAQTSRTCQVCHSRDFCSSCHVNAAVLAPIQALDSDPRVAQLMQGRRVRYRPPAGHAQPDFLRAHGIEARRGAEACANCHTRESCLVCHGQAPRVPIIASLPRRTRGGAQGVDLAAMRPPGHLPDFRLNHRAAAAGGDASCSRCHAQSYCASCHDAASRPAFHPANFVTRHASSSYTQENECATCHQVQVFCRDCHRQTGTVPTGASVGGNRYHDNQPTWLFGHGGAARRSLESCVACHQQRFCLQCHSASTGWKINPHGPGFDTDMGNRNGAMCRICHTQGPPSR